MFNGSDVVTMLFGIDGMRVLAQAEIVDERWLNMETTTDVVGWHGVRNPDGPARPPQGAGPGSAGLRPAGGAVVVQADLALPRVDCTTKTWTEQHPATKPRQVLTERARFEICRPVGADGWSVARAARALGLAGIVPGLRSSTTAHR